MGLSQYNESPLQLEKKQHMMMQLLRAVATIATMLAIYSVFAFAISQAALPMLQSACSASNPAPCRGLAFALARIGGLYATVSVGVNLLMRRRRRRWR